MIENGIDERRVQLAKPLLDGDDHIVVKPTRFGMTTTLAIAIAREGKTAVFVEPTTAIAGKTLKTFGLVSQHIYGNQVCDYNRALIEQDPYMSQVTLPLPQPDSSACRYCNSPCYARNMDSSSKLITVTYAMFNKIYASEDPTLSPAKMDMRAAALKADYLVLDESHLIMTTSAVQVSANIDLAPLESILKDYWTVSLDRLFSRYRTFQESYKENVATLMEMAKKAPKGYHIMTLRIPVPLMPLDILGLGQKIKSLAMRRKEIGLSEREIDNLKAMVQILADDNCKLVYTLEGGVQQFNIVGATTALIKAIQQYVELNPNAAVIFISGSSYRLNRNTYGNIIGRRLRHDNTQQVAFVPYLRGG